MSRLKEMTKRTIRRQDYTPRGNQVMRDGTMRDRVSSELGGLLCFEMEAAGLMNTLPSLVIRGICDYANSHKNKRWQPFAAATAAAYAKEILSVIPVKDGTPLLSEVYAANRSPKVERMLETNCQKVLISLMFPQIRNRLHMIGAPCTGTAEWLFQSEDYKSWKMGQSMFLWLKGKAGAGKSTLMKRTLEEPRHTTSGDSRTLAAFFFDATGTYLERSASGFFRSILH
ncbi:hypothetical protein F5Y16DRAFT_416032 [Xylariaceae sp. FL0255]|nr:hypothetical protein F5Y16DRAFT_416032 [Xylariaceae sp. FL0255]